MTQILVGYEISGDPRRAGREVSVPLKHTAVLGQTQESGKTTTQEAMITRSGLRAVAFLTKRGEQSFRLSQPIRPFFREAQDDYWNYAVSVLEGMLEMKLGFRERGLLLKFCSDYKKGTPAGATSGGKKKPAGYSWKAPSTLTELLENVRTGRPYMRGGDELIAMQLERNLGFVIPEINIQDFSPKLVIRPGINVMDITSLSTALQSLVIRSVIEWVHQKEKNTIVIIPEAWKFIPQGRSTPVKNAVERLIREGAGIKNFVWIDSQDLRGIEKNLMRSVGVWLFGVQREKNEVVNTLESIPDLPRPTPADIMRLGKGEFFVAWGSTCIRTYVRPAGMEAEQARAIARGEESADTWKSIVRQLDEKEADPDDESGLRGGDIVPAEETADAHAKQSRDTVGHGEGAEGSNVQSMADTPGETGIETTQSGDDEMWKEKYEQLSTKFDQQQVEFDTLRDSHDKMAKRLDQLLKANGLPAKGAAPASADNGGGAGAASPTSHSVAIPVAPPDFPHGGVPSYNSIYQYVRDRALAEKPALLQLLVDRPEIEISVPKRIIQSGDQTSPGRLALLIHEKFFDSPRDAGEITREFKRRGWFDMKASNAALIKPLEQVTEWGFFTREADGYQVVAGMKVNVVKS